MPNALPVGGRAYAETHFIDFLQTLFSDIEHMQWSADPNTSKIFIGAHVSFEDQESLPRIIVKVGGLQDFGGAIGDNLKSRTDGDTTHVHLDQSFVAIVCMSEVEQEASDMAYHVRENLFLARPDFRARGFFGMTTPQVSEGQPNIMGTLQDHAYASTVQTSYYLPRKNTITQSSSLPLYEGVGVGGGGGSPRNPAGPVPPGIPTILIPSWGDLPETAELTTATAEETDGYVKVYIQGNHPMVPYRPSGVQVFRGSTEIPSVCVGDPHNDFGLVVEVETRFKYGLHVTYTPGDLVSEYNGISFESFYKKL